MENKQTKRQYTTANNGNEDFFFVHFFSNQNHHIFFCLNLAYRLEAIFNFRILMMGEKIPIFCLFGFEFKSHTPSMIEFFK